MRPLAIVISALLLYGTAWAEEAVPYKEMLHRNGANSSKLTLGMTKAQVLETMGAFSSEVRDGPLSNPWKIEAFVKEDDTIEVLYYLVKRHPPFTPIRESQAIAVVLKNGSVVAWGRGAEAPFKQQ